MTSHGVLTLHKVLIALATAFAQTVAQAKINQLSKRKMRNNWRGQKGQEGTGVENSWIRGRDRKTDCICFLDSLVHFRLIESFKSAETRERGERAVWAKRVRELPVTGNGLVCLFSYPW